MIWWILGAIGLLCAFVAYCCVVVGARADRRALVKLWENPPPSTQVEPQTIPITLERYM